MTQYSGLSRSVRMIAPGSYEALQTGYGKAGAAIEITDSYVQMTIICKQAAGETTHGALQAEAVIARVKRSELDPTLALVRPSNGVGEDGITVPAIGQGNSAARNALRDKANALVSAVNSGTALDVAAETHFPRNFLSSIQPQLRAGCVSLG